jgi:hypothetical protein
MEEQKNAVYKKLEDLRSKCEPFDKLAKDEEQRVSTEENGKKHISMLGTLFSRRCFAPLFSCLTQTFAHLLCLFLHTGQLGGEWSVKPRSAFASEGQWHYGSSCGFILSIGSLQF